MAGHRLCSLSFIKLTKKRRFTGKRIIKMASRGKKSAASTQVPALKPVSTSTRLSAPLHMSDAEISVWAQVVNDQPAASFTDTHIPLLEQYCRHVVQSRVIAEMIRAFDSAWANDDDGLKRYDKMLAMQEREGRAASSLATRLRITRQAIDQQTAARAQINAPKGRKPWELAIDG